MTVSTQQWNAIAQELHLSLHDLYEWIEDVNKNDPGDSDTLFDRDLDGITLGEYVVLMNSRSYRFVAETTLPSGHWVATIWRGLNEEGAMPPVVFESSVFMNPPMKGASLGEALHREEHGNEGEACVRHASLVDLWTRRTS